jgi:hypothetical protein
VAGPSERAVREAWAAVYHLSSFDLWRYRAGLLCIVGLIAATMYGSPAVAGSFGIAGIVLSVTVLIGIRRRYRDHPDRQAATTAGRSFWRYVLTGREP